MISDFTRSNCLRDAPDEHFVWENGFKMSNNAFCKQSCINPARSLLSVLSIIAHGYTACMSRLAFQLVARFVCETKATKRRASSHAILTAERVSFVAVHKSLIPEKNEEEEEERNAFFFLSVTLFESLILLEESEHSGIYNRLAMATIVLCRRYNNCLAKMILAKVNKSFGSACGLCCKVNSEMTTNASKIAFAFPGKAWLRLAIGVNCVHSARLISFKQRSIGQSALLNIPTNQKCPNASVDQ
ncbi:hypothetical protein T01_10004 [Trichinella spiralis]|uniref:Uncharacterized protein n=1 Tax=Trichinella spiralis TaxID=6334 RepID=A0A0V1BG86_TRISP|nr:hypothetical protein T01_10004 [Trichinella spiralis]